MLTILRRSRALLDDGARWRWVALIAMALGITGLEVVGAALMLSLLTFISSANHELRLPLFGAPVDRFPGMDPDVLLIITAGLMAAFFLCRSAAALAQIYIQNRISYDAAVRLSRRMLRGYFGLPYIEFTRRSSAELLRNTHELPLAFAYSVLVPGASIANEALVLLAILGVLLVSAPVVTVGAILVLAPVVLVLLLVVSPKLSRYGRLTSELSVSSMKELQHTFAGMRDIVVLGRQPWFEREFFETRSALARVSYSRAVLADAPRLTLEATVLTTLLAFIALSTAFGRDTASTVKILGLFSYGILRAIPSLGRVLVAVNGLRFARPIVDTLYDDVRANDLAARPTSDGAEIPTLTDCLRIQGLSFAYPGQAAPALRGIDLTIRRGERVALVGPSGGGKSTLVDVVVGLIDPDAGRVTVDGVDIARNRRSWQAQIGLVPQDPFILDDTVVRNIAFGVEREAIDDDLLRVVVRIAQLDEVLDRLPEGIDTVLSERGLNLSGGERQRITIARALYRQPELLIFDEGTSALDTATERRFLAALREMAPDTTVLTVAHRLTTVEDANLIAVVAGGEIVDRGTFADLAASSALFRRLSAAS